MVVFISYVNVTDIIALIVL